MLVLLRWGGSWTELAMIGRVDHWRWDGRRLHSAGRKCVHSKMCRLSGISWKTAFVHSFWRRKLWSFGDGYEVRCNTYMWLFVEELRDLLQMNMRWGAIRTCDSLFKNRGPLCAWHVRSPPSLHAGIWIANCHVSYWHWLREFINPMWHLANGLFRHMGVQYWR